MFEGMPVLTAGQALPMQIRHLPGEIDQIRDPGVARLLRSMGYASLLLSSCQLGAVHTWHTADSAPLQSDHTVPIELDL